MSKEQKQCDVFKDDIIMEKIKKREELHISVKMQALKESKIAKKSSTVHIVEDPLPKKEYNILDPDDGINWDETDIQQWRDQCRESYGPHMLIEEMEKRIEAELLEILQPQQVEYMTLK